MTKEIMIGDKPITFTSNGATPLYYRNFFKKDLLKVINTDNGEMELATENIPELAFIMAKQADKANMLNLEMKHYFEWLEQFNPLDLTMLGKEIFMVYVADSVPIEEPKKKGKGRAKE